MYIGTGSPRNINYKADLISPSMQPTGGSGMCVKFWFAYSSKQTIGKLSGDIMQVLGLEETRAPDKMHKINFNRHYLSFSSPNPMFDHLF